MLDPDFDPAKLEVILFPNPMLRYQAKPVRKVDLRLRKIIQRMFDLMYEHRGVGLAATQVALPLRMFVMNPTGDQGTGKEFVMINPEISRPRSNEEAEEGCLSLPGLHGNVVRSKTIRVNAYDRSGNEIKADFSGFEARIIQHETDHLNGTLFIDRMKEGAILEMAGELEALTTDFESRQRTGAIASNETWQALASDWEALYC